MEQVRIQTIWDDVGRETQHDVKFAKDENGENYVTQEIHGRPAASTTVDTTSVEPVVIVPTVDQKQLIQEAVQQYLSQQVGPGQKSVAPHQQLLSDKYDVLKRIQWWNVLGVTAIVAQLGVIVWYWFTH